MKRYKRVFTESRKKYQYLIPSVHRTSLDLAIDLLGWSVDIDMDYSEDKYDSYDLITIKGEDAYEILRTFKDNKIKWKKHK
jgi:hypothetical protein